MESDNIYVINILFSGLIPPMHLNDLLRNIMEYRRDLWSLQEHPKVQEAPLVTTILMGKLNQLKIFLRYGFEKKVAKKLQFVVSLQYVEKALNIGNRNERVSLRWNDVQQFIQNGDPKTERRRRLLVETFTVACCLYSSLSLFHPTSLCYELAWLSTPDPYVKHDEMFEEMVKLCGMKRAERVSEICETFRKRFGKDTEGPIEPRFLKHLCRCTIRRILAKTFRLPHVIDELDLPHPLKEYLTLNI